MKKKITEVKVCPGKTSMPELSEEAIKYGVTKVHIGAAFNSRSQARKCVKSANLDVNIRDRGGNSPLHYAARFNNLDMIALLAIFGADIEAKNNHGQTALYCAFQTYELKAVEMLRLLGASTKVMDLNGTCPAATKRLRTKKNAPIPLLAGLDKLVN